MFGMGWEHVLFAWLIRESVGKLSLPEKMEIHVSSDSHGDEETPNFKSRRIARRAFHKTYVNYDNNLDLKSVKAEFKDGLLRLEVPPRPEAEPFRIGIKWDNIGG